MTALLAATLAAPVPKAKTGFGEFGERSSVKSESKFGLTKDGALTITVPAKSPAVKQVTPPMVGKAVSGDFVLTARFAHALPEEAKSALAETEPTVSAGVSVFADGAEVDGVVVVVDRLRKKDGWITGLGRGTRVNGADKQWLAWGAGADVSKPVFLRVTRLGKRVSIDWGTDGEKWRLLEERELPGLEGDVFVGPVAYQCTDKEFTATFDQYKIEPVEKDTKK